MNKYQAFLENVNSFREDLLEQSEGKFPFNYKGLLLTQADLENNDPDLSKIMQVYELIKNTPGFIRFVKTKNGIDLKEPVEALFSYTKKVLFEDQTDTISWRIQVLKHNQVSFIEREAISNVYEEYFTNKLSRKLTFKNY